MIYDKTTRLYQKKLALKEIKPTTLTDLSVGTISAIKNGEKKVTLKSEQNLKIAFHNLYIELNNFSKKEVEKTDDYFSLFLDISSHKSINFKEIYSSIPGVKPNYGILVWSYWNSDYNRSKNINFKGKETVEKFESFFQQFRFEIKLLSTKLKI